MCIVVWVYTCVLLCGCTRVICAGVRCTLCVGRCKSCVRCALEYSVHIGVC